MKNLINYWKQLDFESKPYIHPEDNLSNGGNCCQLDNHVDYVSNDDFWQKKGQFHTNLLPTPYVGNLATAKIFILLLNPGLNLADYYAEQNLPEFRDELKRNILQEELNPDYPFLFLNPKYL